MKLFFDCPNCMASFRVETSVEQRTTLTGHVDVHCAECNRNWEAVMFPEGSSSPVNLVQVDYIPE